MATARHATSATEYGDGEEFDTYECMECRREDPKHCTFDNPARLPLEDPNDDD